MPALPELSNLTIYRTGYKDTPANLCALALRIASKSVLQTSVVSLFILGYCVVLCWTGSAPEEGSAEFQALRVISWLSIAVWCVELVAKGAGFGLRPFLRNNWNILDSICFLSLVVDTSFLPGVSFAYLRLLRVCRPLFRFRCFAQFQRTLDSICRSFRLLPPILALTSIFMFLCAVLGSQLFGSEAELYNRCVKRLSSESAGSAVQQDNLQWSARGEDTAIDLIAPNGWPRANEYAMVVPESHCVNMSGLGKYSCDESDGQVLRASITCPNHLIQH
jgi:hypothetical protein